MDCFFILFKIYVISNILIVKSYFIFPLKYLDDSNYIFKNDQNVEEPEKQMKDIYYRNIMTKIEIGSPKQEIPLFIKTNSDKFYITSIIPSVNSTEKNSDYYLFSNDDFYDETLSESYIEGTCRINKYSFYPYDEICESTESINFYINKDNILKVEFPITLVRNIDENIPGYIGLLNNDLEYHTTDNLFTRAYKKKLITNYNWFFDFDEINPLTQKLKGNLIIGGEPHEIFPNKYSFNDLEVTSSYKTSLRDWRLLVDSIYIDNSTEKYTKINGRIVDLNYDIYNIITTMEFHNIIKKLIMDELIKEKKCFKSNFTQNLYKKLNLSFYYCDKSIKSTLYEKIPNLKFTSIALNITFELTKEDLFYETEKFIYFMIIFANEPNTNWIMGQMFTLKYHFCFKNDIQQIGLYKKISNNEENENKDINNKDSNNGLSTEAMIAIIVVIDAIIFLIIGMFLGKIIFGKKRKKIRGDELQDEENDKFFIDEFNINNESDGDNPGNVNKIQNEKSSNGINDEK